MEVYISEQLICIAYAVLLGAFFGLIYDALKYIRNIFNNKLTINGLKNFLYKRKHPVLHQITEQGNKRKNDIIYKIKLFFWDLLFFIIITPITQIFIYATSFGVVRWYIFIAIGVGFLIYYFTLSRIIKYVFEPIICLFIIVKEYIKLPLKKFLKHFKYKAMLRKNNKQLRLKKKLETKRKEERKELICFGMKR